MNIILIGGYARSGKSTSVQLLRDRGIPCYSTSASLYDTYARLKEVYPELHHLDPDNKQVSRQRMIALAEEVIVPVFGRESIVMACVKWLEQVYEMGHETVAIETIGGNELELLERGLKYWSQHPLFITAAINIRSDTEEPDADSRRLIESSEDYYAAHLWNDGNIARLETILFNEISVVEEGRG
jgi:hypothetical protein